MNRSDIRWYSEADHTLGPPGDQLYKAMRRCEAFGEPHESQECGCEQVPVQLPRDTRMWMSVEWARERGIPVPPNWRELE